MEGNQKASIADKLNQARVNASSIEQFGGTIENFTQDDAYAIQELGIQFRESQGEKVIALKMGLTSQAKRKQMDLDSPLYGVLTDKMLIENYGSFSMQGSIHPKIEPEVAFSINKELKGKVTRDEVLAACDGIYAALEILDSRYKQFKYFSMEEVISDNSSSSHYILSEKISNFKGLDLKNLKMKMSVNGQLVQEGNSKAISDDPVVSVIQLAELLAKRNQSIKPGMIVLAGAATPAHPLEPGINVELEVEALPKVEVKITE